MQNFFTREDVLAYHQQGVQTIRLDSMPILTDLARETLQTLGMEIVTGAAPAALLISMQNVFYIISLSYSSDNSIREKFHKKCSYIGIIFIFF